MPKRRISIVFRTISAVLICLCFASYSLFQIRYCMAVLGLIDLPQANAYEYPLTSSDEATLINSPRITVSASYCSEMIALYDESNPDGNTVTALTFDTSWFSRSSYLYNHELATACSVLSAVCNSESQFYGNVNGAIPCAEQTLSALGFTDIRSDSYALRSDLLDQISAMLMGSSEVAAYVFASKTIPGEEGLADKTLIFVGIRGSYGTEWLSNLMLFKQESGTHHPGLQAAGDEILNALEAYLQELEVTSDDVEILLTGHSRGGSLANLVAAHLIDRNSTGTSLAHPSNIYAYTFAAPGITQAPDCTADRYGNIFNIINPSDAIAEITSFAAGYDRYGCEILLPDSSRQNFQELQSAMEDSYLTNTNLPRPCDPDDLSVLEALTLNNGTSQQQDADGLAQLQALCSLLEAAPELEISALLYAHCPDIYIAWMQSIDEQVLMPDP